MQKTLVYGQVACPEGHVRMCLNRWTELGSVVTWPDGRNWKVVERYESALAGGYFVSFAAGCAWFRAEPA